MKKLIVLFLSLIIWSNIGAQCSGTISFTTDIPLSASGTYPPGTVVTLCVEMDGWNDVGVNWFEGFGLNLGAGWVNVNPTVYPTDCNSFAGTTDQWVWVNTVTSSATGNSAGPGFFFEGPSGPVDGDPGNDYGDMGTTCAWEFCVELTASNIPTDDLTISVNVYSDGDMGSWGNTGCVGADPPTDVFPPGTVVGCLVYGCIDPIACNFNPLAGCDDGSCTLAGCIDPIACNYNINAACDNGTCTYGGCTDPLACNFSPLAGCDDGSCGYFSMGEIRHNLHPCPDTTCTGSEVFYNVSGNQSSIYNWNITGGGLLTTDFSNSCEILWDEFPGTYTITVQETTAEGCVGNIETCDVVVVVPNITFDVSGYSMCLNGSQELNASPAGGQWNSEFMNSNLFVGTKPGTYYPSYSTNIYGCDIQEEIKVEVRRKYNAPDIIYSAEIINFCTDSNNQIYIADDTIGTTYGWFVDNVKQNYTDNQLDMVWYDTTQTYIIKVIAYDEIGCESEPKLISVRTETCQRFFAPNSFTPNGDGTNDIFEIRGMSVYRPTLRVFNRWGVEVHRTSNLYWTGDGGSGYYCENGVYNWIIEYKDKFGQNKQESGYVTLIR